MLCPIFCPICKSEVLDMVEQCPICGSKLYWDKNKAKVIAAERPKVNESIKKSKKMKLSRNTIDVIIFIVVFVIIGIIALCVPDTNVDSSSTASTTRYVSPGITGEYYYKDEYGEAKIKIKNGVGKSLKISFDGNDLMGIPGNIIQWESTLWYNETINGLEKYECLHSGYDEYYWFFDETNHTLSYGNFIVLEKE